MIFLSFYKLNNWYLQLTIWLYIRKDQKKKREKELITRIYSKNLKSP